MAIFPALSHASIHEMPTFYIGEARKRYTFRTEPPPPPPLLATIEISPGCIHRLASFVLLLLLFLNNAELNIVLSEHGDNSARHNVYHYHLGLSLSSDVFERRTSTGSGPFSILARLDATKFVLLGIFILIVYNYPPKGR